VPAAAALQPGLDAYREGDHARAARLFETLAVEQWDDAERACLLALGRLASSMGSRARGDLDGAARAFAEAESMLGGLPDVVLGLDVLELRADLARGFDATRPAPELRAYTRFPLGATLRFASLLLIVVGAAVALRFTPLGHLLLDRTRLVATFARLRESTWAPFVLLGLYFGLAPAGLPMTPLIIASGVVYGPMLGALYNIVGCLGGAATSYGVARVMGRDFIRRVAGRRLKRVETLLRRHGFWTLVGVRFLPVPFPVVNFGAALAGVPFPTFMLTAAIGLTPSLLVYTNFAATLFEVARGGSRAGLWKPAAALATVMAISVTPAIVQRLRRRKRYRELLVARHARRQRPS
jgi:uncharacterized membrane protein YdjX (TVP38/TMEM64 family)